MILPIVAYGDPVLKKRAEDISRDYPELEKLIADMFETMESADGVGLAAPQVGLGIRLFVVDAAPFSEDEELPKDEREFLKGFRRAFINPVIEEEWGDPWGFEEGCLSIRPSGRYGIHRQAVAAEQAHDTKTTAEHQPGTCQRALPDAFSSSKIIRQQTQEYKNT